MKKPTLNLLLTAAFAGMTAVTAPGEEGAAATASNATVIATEMAPPYVYVQLEIDGVTNWYAAPEAAFTLGEKIEAPEGGLPMKDFYSKTLDRTFDMVYFVGSINRPNGAGEESLPPGHPPINAAATSAPSEIDLSGIERPEDATPVAQIYAQKDALAGESVTVHGRVVKVSNNILGTNWVHLRDGSGDADSDDLTLTTQETVTVGETVTMRGTVSLDRDFGAGYKYDVLLEAAELQP